MMSGTSIAGPLLFFLCLLPFSQFYLGKCTWMPKSEQLGKSAKNKLPSWAAEKWRTSRWQQLSACSNVLSDKMLNFFVSHSDLMHVNILKSERLAWLALTNTSKIQQSTRYILFLSFPQTLNHDTAHCGSTEVHVWDYFYSKVQPFPSKPRNTLAPAYNPFFFFFLV